jgi:hypothetical protein
MRATAEVEWPSYRRGEALHACRRVETGSREFGRIAKTSISLP